MKHVLLTILVALLCAVTWAQSVSSAQPHLKASQCPDGTHYLPAPPTLDDPRFVNDWLLYRWGIAQRQDSVRCQLAITDGSRSCAKVLKRFAPAIGFTITADNAPKVFAFMERLRQDATMSTIVAKEHYERLRPYQQFQEHTPCPEYEDDLHTSYPSSHTAQGWLYALVLTYFDPDCQDEILRIGYDYGDSRLILGFHYQSDIDAGRLTASATFARLLADADFLADLQEAKAEYLALKEKMMQRPIVVLYDNDVHCGIDGYAKIAALRDSILASDTAYVAVVSSGDFIQGGPTGTLSKGQYIIDILNAVGYDAVTIGNHEFDYGTPRLLELTEQLQAPVTCVNFSDFASGQQFYAPYVMKQFGARRVAFVGVLTPSTLQAESAAFYNYEGRQLFNLHYDYLFQYVQLAVDQARSEGADYVVVLSHLGEVGSDRTSGQLISATRGIDAVLDGHSHAVIPCDHSVNRDGQDVILTQTGTKFANIGKLLIPSQGPLSTTLLPTADISAVNARVAAVVDSLKAINAAMTSKVCGYNEQLLSVYDEQGVRLCRRAEIALGNLIADAFRWYGDSQLAFCNGGGIRTDLPQGDVTYGGLMNVQPFENELCVIRVSGSLLCDVLEEASASCPQENGMFAHPSGFRYTIDTNSSPRVRDVEVLTVAGDYEPIDPEAEYTLTTSVYLTSQYNGLLKNAEVVRTNIGADIEATYNYLSTCLNGRIGFEYARPQGRITIR